MLELATAPPVGACSADNPEAAEALLLADVMDCGRAVDRPETGSVFPVGGQIPLVVRFLAPQSPLVAAEVGLVAADPAEMVELDEAFEERDEEELVL